MFWFHLSSWPGRGPDPGSDKVMVKNGSGNNGNRLGSSMIFNDFQKGSSGSNACLRAGRQCLQQGLLRGRSHYLSSKELCCGCRSYSDQGLIPPCLCFFSSLRLSNATSALRKRSSSREARAKAPQDFCRIVLYWQYGMYGFLWTVKISQMSGFKSLKVKIARTKEASNGGIQPHMSIVGQVGHT